MPNWCARTASPRWRRCWCRWRSASWSRCSSCGPTLGRRSPFGWGRLRYAHTQGIMLGWLGNAFLAFLYHAVPAADRPRGHQRAAGLVAVRPVELRGRGAGLGARAGRCQPAAGMGRVPAGGRRVGRARSSLLAAVQFLPPFFRAASSTCTCRAGTSSAAWSSRCWPTRWATSCPNWCPAPAAPRSAASGFTTRSGCSSRRSRSRSSTS